jgi:murein DD-endopeptidase MepM/ murein hydrolase activator NlpD
MFKFVMIFILVTLGFSYFYGNPVSVIQGMVNKKDLLAVDSFFPIYFPLKANDFKRISSSYGYRKHPVHNSFRKHKGIDLAADSGKVVMATGNGTVTTAAYGKKYGNYIVIDHGNDVKTTYAHLSKKLVKEGDFVYKFSNIGFVGSTGMSTGPHLHYEIKIGDTHINPMLVWTKMIGKK